MRRSDKILGVIFYQRIDSKYKTTMSMGFDCLYLYMAILNDNNNKNILKTNS